MNELQGTSEWFDSKRGNVGASHIADIMAKGKGGAPSASRKNYMVQLLLERLTGETAESYTSPSMQWGTDTEPLARAAYEERTFRTVELCGFIMTPDGRRSGASPDGLVNGDGLIEIKCPNTATHIETLLSKQIDTKYIMQMQWQMYATGRKWCDFVSYDPRVPENLRMFVSRVPRIDKMIEEQVEAVRVFLEELDAMVEKLKNYGAEKNT